MINGSAVREIRWVPGSENLFLAAHGDGHLILYDKEREDAPFVSSLSETKSAKEPDKPRIIVESSMHTGFQKSNPVSCWKVAKRRITGLSFSPDGRHIAVVSEDGALRVIDYAQEKYVPAFIEQSKGRVLTKVQTHRPVPELLRRLQLCMLVARRTLHPHRRTRRSTIPLVVRGP